jgi:hypothetical protein
VSQKLILVRIGKAGLFTQKVSNLTGRVLVVEKFDHANRGLK